MLTGEPPFTGDSPMAVAFARLRQPPPDPAGRAGVPEALAEVVRRCVAREPEERPSGAFEVAGLLRAWLTSVGEPTEAVIARVRRFPVLPLRARGTHRGAVDAEDPVVHRRGIAVTGAGGRAPRLGP